MRYRIVFWDIDGTIFHGEDPAEGFADCPSLREIEQNAIARAKQTLVMFGHSPPSDLSNLIEELTEELKTVYGNLYSFEILAEQLYRRLGLEKRKEESLLLADALWGPRYREWVYTGCAEVLATLAGAGVMMGVITNNAATERMMRNALTGVGLADFFGPVICSCEVGARKPDPRIFNAALAALAPNNRSRGSILYVGDNPTADIGGAIACGWDAALHHSKPLPEHAAGHTDPVLSFTDYRELVDLIL